MVDDGLDIPQPNGDDVLHIAISSAISAVPFFGIGASEWFKLIVSPSLDNRKEQWTQVVAEAIRDLRLKHSFTIAELGQNEEFVTLLLQATQSAMRTHVAAKYQMLKVALVSTIIADAEFDVKQLYMNMVVSLSPTHVALLRWVDKNSQATVEMESGEQFYQLFLGSTIFEPATLDFNKFLAFLRELEQAGLIAVTEGLLSVDKVYNTPLIALEGYEGDDYPRMNITELARDFMSFVGLNERYE